MTTYKVELLKLAVELELLLKSRRKKEQSDLILKFATACGKHPNTIRRVHSNFARVVAFASDFRIPLQDVVAPMSSIETLARIAKLSPTHAMAYTRQTLLGDLSYARLMRLCDMLLMEAADDAIEARDRFDIASFVRQIISDLAPIAAYRETEAMSELARTLKVDLEFIRSKNETENVLAVISPAWKNSFSQRKYMDVAAIVLAASCYFEVTYFVAFSEEDWEKLYNFIKTTRMDLSRIKKICP